MDWQQIVLFAILGLGAGSLIAGIAVGIVVTFRGSGIINLATGAVAMVAGYSYWSLKTGSYGVHVPTAPALVITFLVLLALGLLVEFGVFRPLRTAAPLAWVRGLVADHVPDAGHPCPPFLRRVDPAAQDDREVQALRVAGRDRPRGPHHRVRCRGDPEEAERPELVPPHPRAELVPGRAPDLDREVGLGG
jgi:hypothetical protein